MPSFRSIDALKATVMTETIRRLDLPRTFWRTLLFSDERTLENETVELGKETRTRRAAPFVRSGSSAIMVRGRNTSLAQFETPNIRIKKPFNPGDVMFDRGPGEPLYNARLQGKMQRRMAKDLEDMEFQIREAEEFLCASVVKGVISYDVPGQDSFIVDYGKPADTVLSLADSWDGATPAIQMTFMRAKRDLAGRPGGGFGLTDAVMGSNATDAFMADEQILKKMDSTVRVSIGGPLDFTRDLEQNGAVQFLGSFMGVRCWSYVATTTLSDGSVVELTRPDYVEFVAATRGAMNRMYYGGITDPRALQAGGPEMKRFSKSWFDEDPGTVYSLLQSRPLPVALNPDSMQSYKVTNV